MVQPKVAKGSGAAGLGRRDLKMGTLHSARGQLGIDRKEFQES